jgi:hypothetical protein
MRLNKNSTSNPAEIDAQSRQNEVQFQIEFTDPHQKPIRCKPRPIPFNLRDKVKVEINTLLNAGIIQESKSCWSSPIRIVLKPDGSVRITVDYSPINRVMKLDSYPMPLIKSFFAELSKDKYFAKIDWYKAYHQIPCHPDTIPITAFVCEFGLFEYTSMPMGISTAPACFQRYMEHIMKDLILEKTVNPYMDDIFIHTTSLTQHEITVNKVIDVLENKQLKASSEKSDVLVKEITILGHRISEGQIRSFPRRAECIKNMPKPTTVNELQRFLGSVNYSRNHIDQ